MALDSHAQAMRDQFEAAGIYLHWHSDGRVTDVSPSDALRIIFLSWARTSAVVDEMAVILGDQRKLIRDLEDEVSDLKGFVYHGEETGV